MDVENSLCKVFRHTNPQVKRGFSQIAWKATQDPNQWAAPGLLLQGGFASYYKPSLRLAMEMATRLRGLRLPPGRQVCASRLR